MDTKNNSRTGIRIMVGSSICSCVGQLLWKLSAQYGIWMIFWGFCLYALGAMMMIIAYRFGKLSVLQPILSLNYALSILLGAFFLNEPITMYKGLGVAVIVCGVILIVRDRAA